MTDRKKPHIASDLSPASAEVVFSPRRPSDGSGLDTLRTLADYVRWNAPAVGGSGLYDGRAGLALCLFECAALLGDEVLEQSATTLLRQALAAEVGDAGFERGQAGIGFALAYLTRRGLVEASYDDLYGRQTRAVAERLTEAAATCFEGRFGLVTALRLAPLCPGYGLEQTAREALPRLFGREAELWRGLLAAPGEYVPESLARRWRTLLSVAWAVGHAPAAEDLEPYRDVYRRGRLKYDPVTFCYLSRLAETGGDEAGREFLSRYGRSGRPPGVTADLVTLSEETTRLYAGVPDAARESAFLRTYLSVPAEEVERRIVGRTRPGRQRVGLGGGVARLLLALVLLLSEEKPDVRRLAERIFMD